MEPLKWKEKAMQFLQKYKYVALVLLLGLVLMLLPTRRQTETVERPPAETEAQTLSLSEELTQILSRVQGAGKVQVLLTEAAGAETVYQTDEAYEAGDTPGMTRRDTVTVSDAAKNQTGLVQQVIPAQYLGAVVVCQGADSPAVRLAIVEAVSKATGLGADRISVLKMKG